MKSIIKYSFLLLFVVLQVKAQVAIGKGSVSNGALLDVSPSTGKGVLFPKVILSDLADAQKPVPKPIDGMIVYNISGRQVPGYYIYKNSAWQLIADSYNVITDFLIQSSSQYTMMAGKDNGSYERIPAVANMSQLSNEIAGSSFNPATNQITLPAGAYTVDVIFNNITSKANVNDANPLGKSSRSNLHAYIGQLMTTTGVQLGVNTSVQSLELTSNTLPVVKGFHNASFSFSFKLAATTTFYFQLTHGELTSYGYNIPTTAYTGEIAPEMTFIHIQRALFNQ